MTEGPVDQPTAGQPGPEDPAAHVVVWAESAEARADVEAWLTQQGLEPRTEWETPTSLSYRLNTVDTRAVSEVMSTRSDLAWTVVAPGQPDYVMRYLSVEGPDGRSFRFNDVPAATPVDSVAQELIGQYGADLPGADMPTVVEHVEPAGTRRMDPDSTLAAEGIEEGSRLRVGFERRAA